MSTTYPFLARVAAIPQYRVSGAWREPVVITTAGRLGGPARVAHTVPEITAPLRAVHRTGRVNPYLFSSQP